MGMKANESGKQNINAFANDLRELFKGVVLIANVLPVITGFWLATYFTDSSFMQHFDLFILTILGSGAIMAGALVLNKLYEVDFDIKMFQTLKRPTVTGNFTLQTVLWTGIDVSV